MVAVQPFYRLLTHSCKSCYKYISSLDFYQKFNETYN